MRSPASISGAFKAVGDPTYVQGRNRSELLAHFPSGTSVQVELSRRRRYPGLSGPAPTTHLCYRKFLALGANTPRIVDVGCGAGIGLRCLLQTKARLTGIDSDGKAVAFARSYVPDAEVLHADIHTSRVSCQSEAAIVVDVLGMVEDPARFLRSLLRRVGGIEILFVAEAIADKNQKLLAPARRAFGLSSLRSLLTRSGFRIEDWTTVDDTFLCVIGRTAHDPLVDVLVSAEEAYLSHQTQNFETFCRMLRRSDRADVRLEAALLESRLWFDMSEYGRAIAVLTDACSLVPEDPRPWAGLARLALVSGNSEHAVRLADKAVKLDETDLSSACSSALVHWEADPRRSLEAWRLANALAPDEPRIAQLLCTVALAQGKHEEGLAILEHAGLYRASVSALNDHAGLAALTNAAIQQSLR